MNADVLEMENVAAEDTSAAVQTEEQAPAEGTRTEVTAENLFELVESGEITLEEANQFLSGQEDISSGSEVLNAENGGEAAASGEVQEHPDDAREPYRVFDTQEDFQRVFDNAWNKRYGQMMHDRDAERQKHQALISELGELLGVPPEEAAAELKNRRRRLEAERRGVDPEEFSSRMQAEDERDYYKKQLEEQQKQQRARSVVENVRAQGAKIRAQDANFDIDNAMNTNPEFRQMVFALLPSMPDKAVELSYRMYYGRGNLGAGAEPAKVVPQQQARPVEGGAGGVNASRKPVDFSKMSDAEILKIQDDVISGKKFPL